MSTATLEHGPLGALEQALQEERRALLDNDVMALLASTEAKVRALRQAEAHPPPAAAAARLDELRRLNQANGVLLARRRREVD
ncbi:flagellar protein FlgN, partial [Pseudoxanthomonas sp. X-1]